MIILTPGDFPYDTEIEPAAPLPGLASWVVTYQAISPKPGAGVVTMYWRGPSGSSPVPAGPSWSADDGEQAACFASAEEAIAALHEEVKARGSVRLIGPGPVRILPLPRRA